VSKKSTNDAQQTILLSNGEPETLPGSVIMITKDHLEKNKDYPINDKYVMNRNFKQPRVL